MNIATNQKCQEANWQPLSQGLAYLRQLLEERVALWQGKNTGNPINNPATTLEFPPNNQSSSLQNLCNIFSLSNFERDLLLLCAGMELDANFINLCANAHGDSQMSYPTFSLAMSLLPAAHWSAIAPHHPLRYWRLIEVGGGKTLTLSPLRINERILHYLIGIDYLDEPLRGIIEPLSTNEYIVPSHQQIATKIADILTAGVHPSPTPPLPGEGLSVSGSPFPGREGGWGDRFSQYSITNSPILQLVGEEVASKRAIAQTACEIAGMKIAAISANVVPTNTADLNNIIILWQREARLNQSVLLLDCDEWDRNDAAKENAIVQILENINTPLIVTSRDRRRAGLRSLITFEVSKPSKEEQFAIWENALGDSAPSLNGQVEVLISQFNLSAPSIYAVCTETLGYLAGEQGSRGAGEREDFNSPLPQLWNMCRAQSRPHLDELAQRIEPAATWDDLVLPETQLQVLKEIAAHLRQRSKVYEQWGFAKKGARGLGISALFAGSSGTGKTMSAEVLAGVLQLDLYRIDLSSVVSKYIGETEKNLRRVFDAAEGGATILLFDEADALFGKRSDVKDSHDRYANMEVSYLLQRMEAYQGLAILTTNLKDAIDTAFLRRIRFVVKYPFPDAQQRIEIWRRIFPKNTPTEGLDFTKLARLNVAGGNIRNIALNAAFIAADLGEPVMMKHLLESAKSEYMKLERALTDTEVKGWL
ncbi:MAG TPA: ATP-binding protein [Leptolyngbyaceae cyanobacterium]